MKKFSKLILLILSTLGILWSGGLFWFKYTIPEYQLKYSGKVDAIVVLTGGSDRLEEGKKLISNGYADKLFISGVGNGVRISDIVKEKSMQKKTELGRIARDTKGNAMEVAKWISDNNYKSMMLVTSNYHMSRSILELKSAMPDIIIKPYPVISKNVILDEWWKFSGTRELIISEYNKYLVVATHQAIMKRGD